MSDLINLFKELSEKKQSKIYYYANNGNAGDALINMGFYNLAYNFKIPYELISYDSLHKLKKGDYVIVAGGGCLVPEWDSTPNFVRKINKDYRSVNLIILPHSIREVDDIISNLPNDTIIFCREKYSFEYCLKNSNASSVYLEDDIAFFSDVKGILGSSGSMRNLSVKNFVRKIITLYHYAVSKKEKIIFAMRTDKEANKNVVLERKKINDLSLVASYGAGSYEDSLYSAKQFLSIINLYDEIHTDRLHVSIGAALLNKKVKIYNNGYYKCKGVYEKSMRQMEHVSFIE